MLEFIKSHIVSFTLFSPLIGVFLIVSLEIFSRYGHRNHLSDDHYSANSQKKFWYLGISLICSAIPIILSLVQFANFSSELPVYSERSTFIKSFDINYSVSFDSLSGMFVLLTGFLSFISLLIFAKNKQYFENRTGFGICMILLLEVASMGVFVSDDLFLFYIFFEAWLIPMLFLIGIYGRENRKFAAVKLFIYTILGSLLFLFGAILLKVNCNSSDLETLKTLTADLDVNLMKWVWWSMFLSFAIKIPMFPFHTWLPDAHVEAPTFGSVMLAGIIIKMGGFAMLKFLIPLFHDYSKDMSWIVATLSTFAIVYGSFASWGQQEAKKLIAYSSIAHMGYVTLGLFVPSPLGQAGAIFQMLSHGIVSSALFMALGFTYTRTHTYEIQNLNSLASRFPFLALNFMIFTLGAIGLPSTVGFIGEMFVIVSAGSTSGYMLYAAFSALGMIFGAVYMLSLYKRIFLKTDKKYELKVAENTEVKFSKTENILLLTFSVLIIYFGIQPNQILEKILNSNSVNKDYDSYWSTELQKSSSTFENSPRTEINSN